ncbi:MAG: signal peptidase I [Candidatus Berkelbacteria bacterium]|nr:signal peptidase I [Candidatus Berkelbacteria bacterium]
MEEIKEEKENQIEPKVEEKFSSTRRGLTRAAKFLVEFLETAIIIGLIAFVIRFFLIQPFVVEGASMEPNFHNNDYLLIEKVTERFSDPKRGDVVVFRYPNNLKVNYIKRIIGVPSDTVIIKNGTLKIVSAGSNEEKTINENYLPDSIKTSGNMEIKLDKDQFFVLGDNRSNSSDSREWGVLPKQNIVGRAWLVVLPATDFGIVPRVQYNF